MKNTFTQHLSYLNKTLSSFWMQSCTPKIIGVVREMEHWLGIRFVKVELTNLNHYSTNLLQRFGKNYQSQQKKIELYLRFFVSVSVQSNAQRDKREYRETSKTFGSALERQLNRVYL